MATANLLMEGWIGVQPWVKSVKITGLSTEPCGVAVLRIRKDEVYLPILT